MRERKGEGRKGARMFTEYGLVHETSMWANMRIFKVRVTHSLCTRQITELCNNYTTYINLRMLKVDRTPPAYGLAPF